MSEPDELKEAVKRFCRTEKASDNLVRYIQSLIKSEVLKELEWAKTASVWNIEHRINELREL